MPQVMIQSPERSWNDAYLASTSLGQGTCSVPNQHPPSNHGSSQEGFGRLLPFGVHECWKKGSNFIASCRFTIGCVIVALKTHRAKIERLVGHPSYSASATLSLAPRLVLSELHLRQVLADGNFFRPLGTPKNRTPCQFPGFQITGRGHPQVFMLHGMTASPCAVDQHVKRRLIPPSTPHSQYKLF